jgi:surface polysaccharide O-acyltransferase-like enzyme
MASGALLSIMSVSMFAACLYYITNHAIFHQHIDIKSKDTLGILIAAAFIIFPGYMGWRFLRGTVSSNGMTYVPTWFLLTLGAVIGLFFIVQECRKPDANLGVIIFGSIAWLLYYTSKRKPPTA